jgi:hypothetical protein
VNIEAWSLRSVSLATRAHAHLEQGARGHRPARRGGADRALIARPVSPAVGVSAIWYANRLLTTPIGTRLTPQMSSVTRADGREPGRRERKERALPCVEDTRARLMARHKVATMCTDEARKLFLVWRKTLVRSRIMACDLRLTDSQMSRSCFRFASRLPALR